MFRSQWLSCKLYRWSTVMSVQSFGFGARLYMFEAVRSLSGLHDMFSGQTLSFRNVNAARRGSLPGPIIMKLCSGRVMNFFISCNARWGNCVSGHSRTFLENPCVSFDCRPEILSCADIFLLEKFGNILSFIPIQQISPAPGGGICLFSPVQKRRKEVCNAR